MNYLRAVLAGVCVAMLAVAGSACLAGGDTYPSKPIRLIVPFPAGGPTDIAARIVADELGKTLGQPVIADNRPGAAGNIAAELAAKAPPDGYTLFFAQTTTHGINPSLYRSLGYDAIKDFTPIGLVNTIPMVLVANPALPVRDVSELIALAKSKPGALNYASGGAGTPPHMAGELFAKSAGLRWTHVAYKGSAPAIPDVIGGRVELMFDGVASALPYIRAGKLKALAVTTAARNAALPEVHTLAETLPGYEASGWGGLVAPSGTPQAVVARLAGALAQVTADEGVKARFEALGMAVLRAPPQKTASHIRAEIEKWRAVVEATGARAE